MTLPLVHVEGEPFEQGRQHGLALGDQIAHNLSVYYDRFLSEGHLPADEVRLRAARYLPVLESYPAYFATMRGIADAAGQSLVDVAMLNVRYELLYYQYSVLPIGGPDGCTSFVALPEATADGHLLIGENWDWIPDVQGAVVHAVDTSGSEVLTFTEAGIVGGKIGLNSHGIGLAVNGLLSTVDDWSRLVKPFHVRCYDILRQSSIQAAASVVVDARRACSANFVLAATPDRAVDIEAAPDTCCSFGAEAGALAHSNHFLDPTHLGVEEPVSERRPHTYSRLARMQSLLGSRRPLSIPVLQQVLRDHDNYPDSICRHEHPDDAPEEACITMASAVMDLTTCSMSISDGFPCENAHTGFSL